MDVFSCHSTTALLICGCYGDSSATVIDVCDTGVCHNSSVCTHIEKASGTTLPYECTCQLGYVMVGDECVGESLDPFSLV